MATATKEVRKVHKFSGKAEAATDNSPARTNPHKMTGSTNFSGAFNIWLRLHKVRPSTHTGYWLVAKKFMEFNRGIVLCRLEDLNSVNVSDFIAEREKTVSKHSARAAYITLKVFSRWLTKNGYPCDLSSVESVKNVPQRNRLSSDQITALLAAAAASTNSDRDLLMVKFVISTGVRLNELRQLQIRDIHLAEGYVQIREETAKNFKARQVRLFPDIKADLFEYMHRYHENSPQTQYLWLTQELKPFSLGGLGGCLRSIKKRAGITDRAGFHSLRHFFAFSAVSAGINTFDLQTELGHSNIQTSARYVSQRPPEQRAALTTTPLAIALAGSPDRAMHKAYATKHAEPRTTHTEAKSRVRFGDKKRKSSIKTGLKRI